MLLITIGCEIQRGGMKMEEKYELRFAKIETWIEENPDEAAGVAIEALMQIGRTHPEDIEKVWNAIQVMGRFSMNWPICRCGRIHHYEPMSDSVILSEQPQTPSYEVIPTADGLMVVDAEDIELGLFDDELRELEEEY
jgi:hypothetical protein